MAVKIDMDMPKSCSECRFLYDGYACMASEEILCHLTDNEFNRKRHPKCPLKEIK